MGIRKNAKSLTPAEKENFVKACVLMKAQIVNPAAPAAERYSKWDQYAAIHWMIQDAFAPGDSFVNFGHGGNGSFSFLSWHRYFLFCRRGKGRAGTENERYANHETALMSLSSRWADPGSQGLRHHRPAVVRRCRRIQHTAESRPRKRHPPN